MKHKFLYTLLVSLIISTRILAQTNEATSASQVITNAIEVLGGRVYLESINTMYTDMLTEMEGRQVHWVTKEMAPNKGAFQIVYNNRIVFQNWYNGKTGFEMVNGEKRKADPKEFKDKKYRKHIINELDYLDSTLWKVELVGEEKVGEEACYKIKATLASGRVSMLYYSKATYYLLREDKVSNKEKDSFSTTLFSDYKKFGNLTFYSSMKFGEGNSFQDAKIESLLVNQSITEKDFQ